jgi:hypothetical protein
VTGLPRAAAEEEEEEVISAAGILEVALRAGIREAAPVSALLVACVRDPHPVSEHSLIPCRAVAS